MARASFKLHPFHLPNGDPELFEQSGQLRQINTAWFRGDTVNYLPSRAQLLAQTADLLLHGLTPSEPVITPKTGVLTFGSCFASNVARRLGSAGYALSADTANPTDAERRTLLVGLNEGIANTFTIRQLMEWVFAGERRNMETWAEKLEVWHDKSANPVAVDEAARETTRAIFERAGAFIITLGLAEVWYDKDSGEVYSRAIPKADYDPARHGFRVSTVAENLENLRVVLGYIRALKPHAPVIFSLSPVPLLATFRPLSCVVANSVSKAVLRVAVDELLRSADDANLYYWPSYELVKDVFPDPFEADNRHPRQELVDYIMALFIDSFCSGGQPVDPAEARFRLLAASGLAPKRALKAMERGEPGPLLSLGRKSLKAGDLLAAEEIAAEAARRWPDHPDVVQLTSEIASSGLRVLEGRNAKALLRQQRRREQRAKKIAAVVLTASLARS